MGTFFPVGMEPIGHGYQLSWMLGGATSTPPHADCGLCMVLQVPQGKDGLWLSGEGEGKGRAGSTVGFFKSVVLSLWGLKAPLFLTITEDSKELLFLWVISITLYCIVN